MIHYILPSNPDDRIISKAVKILQEDHIICFPTDTSWVLALGLTKNALSNLQKIKSINPEKHLSLLCSDISQASHYAMISNYAFKIIKKHLPGPYTFIFRPNKHLPKVIQNYKKSKQIGIRIPNSNLCHRIIEEMNGPLLTTSLTKEVLGFYESYYENEILSYQIEEIFKHKIKMILDTGEFTQNRLSSIVDFSNEDNGDSFEIIRKGDGDLSFFE